jgi:DnaJ-class molecular chaperone
VGFFSDLIFGPSYSTRARRDQSSCGTSFKNFISPINSYGTCFSCDGSGKKTLDCSVCDSTGTFHGTCRSCSGSGLFTVPEKPCPNCQGSGLFGRHPCRRCSGQGRLAPLSFECKKCEGSGAYSSTCKKCGGSGDFDVSCRKCGGSGWHRF